MPPSVQNIQSQQNLAALMAENARLKEEVGRYRRLKARSRDFVYIHDLSGNLLECNPTMLRLLGLTASEAECLNLRSIIHPEDRALIETAIHPRTTREGTKRNWEVRMVTKSGAVEWVDFNAWPVRYKGGICIQGVGRITTMRKREEADSKAQAAFLRAVVDTAPDLIFVKDENRRFTFVNKTLADHYAETPENLIHNSDPQYCDNPSELATFEEDDLIALRDGRAERPRETVTNKKGAKHTYKTIKVRISGIDGKPAVLGVSSNIDYLIDAEKKLQDERDLLTTLMNAIPDSIHFKSKDGEFIRVNNAQARFFHADSTDAIIGKTDYNFFDKSDADAFAAEERAIINGGDPVINKIYTFREGNNVVYRSRTKVAIHGKHGMLGILGISRDVTQEYTQKLELVDTKNMLEQVFNAVPQAIFWKSLNLEYRGCNKAFLERYWKTSNNDIIGKSDFDLFGVEDANRYRSSDMEVFLSKEPRMHRRELLIHADGKRSIVEFSKLPLFDSAGNVSGLLGVLDDVSHRTQHYEDLVRFVSHSMKARLTVLEGNLTLLKFQLPENSPELRAMHGAIEMLKDAVLRARKFSIFGERESEAPVAVNSVLAKICDYLGDARAEFVFDPRNPFVFTGWLDLENSLLELITNAVRFAPRREDGGFIRVWVEVETHRCKIHVQNNGPGLPKDPTHPDGYIPPLDPQRPGVGLALTRYTVQKMGGTLTEVGRENEDAHFIIDLALCEPPKTG